MSKEDFMVGQLRAIGITTIAGGQTINVKMRDDAGDILLATGTTVPTATSSGFAKGCIFIDTNVSGGTTGFYINNGTRTSCDFVASASAASVDLSILTSTVTSEIADRAVDESVISSKLTSEITDRDTDESVLQSEVTSGDLRISILESKVASYHA